MSLDRSTLTYVVNTLNAGGTEKLVVEMSLMFATELEVRVVCLDEPGLWAEKLRARGIPVHCLWRQPGFDLALVVRLANFLRSSGTDIVHAHQCTAWLYAALARLIYPKPRLLLEEHGRFYPEPDKPLRRLVNRLLINRLTHRFVAVSADTRARLERFEGIDAQHVQVIYNGVAAERRLDEEERTQLRREFGFGPDDFVVGTVGRFDPVKNLPMLVAALAAAARQEPCLHGLLVGDGEVAEQVRGLVERSGLSNRVRLPGLRTDARKLIQCMDLFVLCSLSEGTSMALLEAMAAGVAVAVTRVGGNPEIVLADEGGWVVPSESIEDLKQTILEAVRDDAKRKRLARAGHTRFEEQFALERMIQAYRRQYHELLA